MSYETIHIHCTCTFNNQVIQLNLSLELWKGFPSQGTLCLPASAFWFGNVQFGFSFTFSVELYLKCSKSVPDVLYPRVGNKATGLCLNRCAKPRECCRWWVIVAVVGILLELKNVKNHRHNLDCTEMKSKIPIHFRDSMP